MAETWRDRYEDDILAINAYEQDKKFYKMGKLFNKETKKLEMTECPIPEFEMKLDEHKKLLQEAVLDLQPYLAKYNLPPLEIPFVSGEVPIKYKSPNEDEVPIKDKGGIMMFIIFIIIIPMAFILSNLFSKNTRIKLSI